MHKIYFEQRCITICRDDDPSLSDPNTVSFHPGGENDLGRLASMFKDGSPLQHVYVPSKDPELVYRRLCSGFWEVNAAGGLVSNRRSDFLLIRRYGLWDLPKGHQEAGEDIMLTATREVSEETGIMDLECRGLICITDHCYLRNGIWHLKHTWWYDMLHTNPVDLTPQREEDISKAVWVARSSLPPYLKDSYPSIREVFREAKV